MGQFPQLVFCFLQSGNILEYGDVVSFSVFVFDRIDGLQSREIFLAFSAFPDLSMPITVFLDFSPDPFIKLCIVFFGVQKSGLISYNFLAGAINMASVDCSKNVRCSRRSRSNLLPDLLKTNVRPTN